MLQAIFDDPLCAFKDCGNGLCTRSTGKCECTAGWSGEDCQTNIDECNNYAKVENTYNDLETAKKDCNAEDSCVSVADGSCNGAPFTLCETNGPSSGDQGSCTFQQPFPDQNVQSCSKHGSCVDGINKFTCNCEAGYNGKTCQTNINDCAGSLCKNGGACTDQVNAFKCNCKAGFSGDTCETNINDCTSVTCSNHGTCVDGVDSFFCKCTYPWSGTDCQLCNGANPNATPDPTPACNGVTPIQCETWPQLLTLCPIGCDSCFASTTATTTTTTGVCNGAGDPDECGRNNPYLASGCTLNNFAGTQIKRHCPVLCDSCIAASSTTTTLTTTEKTVTQSSTTISSTTTTATATSKTTTITITTTDTTTTTRPAPLPNTCQDWPPGWKDSYDEGCTNYAKSDQWYCTSDGGFGPGWDPDGDGDRGPFSDYQVNGVDATQACCACGGGIQPATAATTASAATPPTAALTTPSSTSSSTTHLYPCYRIQCAVFCNGECGWSRAEGQCKLGLTTTQSMIDSELGNCSATDPATTPVTQSTSTDNRTLIGVAVGGGLLLIAIFVTGICVARNKREPTNAQLGAVNRNRAAPPSRAPVSSMPMRNMPVPYGGAQPNAQQRVVLRTASDDTQPPPRQQQQQPRSGATIDDEADYEMPAEQVLSTVNNGVEVPTRLPRNAHAQTKKTRPVPTLNLNLQNLKQGGDSTVLVSPLHSLSTPRTFGVEETVLGSPSSKQAFYFLASSSAVEGGGNDEPARPPGRQTSDV